MKYKLLFFLLFAGSLATLGFLFRQYSMFDELVRYEFHLRNLLKAHPLKGFTIGLVVYLVLSLIPGTGGKSVIYGWLFGFWQGVLIADCALTAAAIVSFLISRRLLRDILLSRFAIAMQHLDRAIKRDGAFYLLALRTMHSPYTATNYAMGTTSIDVKSFWWATQLGLIPGTVIFVWAGTQIPTLETVVEEGAGAVFSLQVIAALGLTGVFPLVARWGIRKIWPRVEKTELAE